MGFDLHSGRWPEHIFEGCSFFGLQLKASCLQLSFFAYSCVWVLFCLQFELFDLQFGLFCLTSTLTDCKQRSSTVSKTAPTVSKKVSAFFELSSFFQGFQGVGGYRNLNLSFSHTFRKKGFRGHSPIFRHYFFPVCRGRPKPTFFHLTSGKRPETYSAPAQRGRHVFGSEKAKCL